MKNDKEYTEGILAQKVTCLVMKFIAHGLEHESNENENPYPVRSAEAGAIEQRKRGKERTAEGDECREGKLPLAPCRVDEQLAFVLGLAGNEYQVVSSLYEEQEHQESAQEGNQEPPILL